MPGDGQSNWLAHLTVSVQSGSQPSPSIALPSSQASARGSRSPSPQREFEQTPP
jgi:hypothetical protein